MYYKLIIFFIFFFLNSCAEKSVNLNSYKYFDFYSNQGFTLIYEKDLLKKKIVNQKIDDRSLIVLNNNLKKDTTVKITNLLNGKNLLAKVGDKSKYPLFYNSVISNRIAKDLEINPSEPYIRIQTLNSSNTFVANKAKTYKEEKKVANKAPVDDITIKNISISNMNKIKKKPKKIVKFNYIIKFADLYFEDSAILLKNRLINEFNIKNVLINKMSENIFRVYKGPFNNLDAIKKEFIDIDKLNFENIEFIKL
tara:strand:+ start:401 stop:1156 length:756 start_codon:yes stop_codon:yes gene_type:complete